MSSAPEPEQRGGVVGTEGTRTTTPTTRRRIKPLRLVLFVLLAHLATSGYICGSTGGGGGDISKYPTICSGWPIAYCG